MSKRRISFLASTKTHREASPLQRLAQQRNWRIVQIKGCCGTLEHIAQSLDRSGIAAQARMFKEQLLKNNDEQWERNKAKLP